MTRKMMNRWLMLAAMMMALFVQSCSSDGDSASDDITGEWTCVNAKNNGDQLIRKGDWFELNINADGTFTWENLHSDGALPVKTTGQYVFTKTANTLRLRGTTTIPGFASYDTNDIYQVEKLTETTLELSEDLGGEDGEYYYVFTREKKSSGGKGGYAPEQLPTKYAFAQDKGSGDVLFYAMETATIGLHTNSSQKTSYSYKKTSDNTATFSCSAIQNINGPIRVKQFYWSGTLTFTAKDKCKYVAERQYIADGVDQGITKETYEFSLLPYKGSFVPRDLYN